MACRQFRTRTVRQNGHRVRDWILSVEIALFDARARDDLEVLDGGITFADGRAVC